MQLLARTALFQGLKPDEFEPLRTACRTRSYETGAYLFREGDPSTHLFVVMTGEVKIGRVDRGGEELVFAIAGPGQAFGELALFEDEGERTADAQALEQTECLVIARAPLLKFIVAQPDLLIRIIGILGGYVRRKDAVIGEAAFLDVPARVASKLVELADSRGHATVDGVVIDLPLKQRTLAGMVGASRESVNRALRQFAQLGLIRQEGGLITILNRDQLRRRGPSL